MMPVFISPFTSRLTRTFTSACDEVQARAVQHLIDRDRPVQVYTTGLLAQKFGLQDDKQPCAVCCAAGETTICVPYYAKEG